MKKGPLKELRKHLRYDPETGYFWWLLPRAKRVLTQPAGKRDKTSYVTIIFNYKPYYAHRLAFTFMTGCWPTEYIDHINGNVFDNRWINLRLATKGQNNVNSKSCKRNIHGVKGVTRAYRASGVVKWRAQICIDYKNHHLGYFDTQNAAHAAYLTAAKTAFGEFVYG